MANITKFYSTLFEPGESTCFSATPYGTLLTLVGHEFSHSLQFFSINPLRGSRCDANVTCYRNILLEFDKLPLGEQLKLIVTIPHSTVVYSGGKSYHAIISLAEPCSTKDEYDTLVRRIYDRLPDVDKSTKNCSRFSRTPMALRDTGALQDLVEVRERVSRAALEAWLGPETAEEAGLGPETATFSAPRSLKLLHPSTLYFLEFGADPGWWNRSLYMSALDLARCGNSEFEVIKRLTAVTGKLDNSDRRTIRSALNAVRKESTT